MYYHPAYYFKFCLSYANACSWRLGHDWEENVHHHYWTAAEFWRCLFWVGLCRYEVIPLMFQKNYNFHLQDNSFRAMEMKIIRFSIRWQNNITCTQPNPKSNLLNSSAYRDSLWLFALFHTTGHSVISSSLVTEDAISKAGRTSDTVQC